MDQGVVLLEEIMELLGISEMKVSGFAVGEGVVAEMVAEAYPGIELNTNVRWKSVLRFAMRFNGNDRMRNGMQCSAIAKDIFEGLRTNNKVVENQFAVDVSLDEKDLEYLQAACMLHNIGLHFGKKGYHKHSYSIIMVWWQEEHTHLDGYTNEEIELIAQLARHHRKKFPKSEHSSLQGFSSEALEKKDQPMLTDTENSSVKDVEAKLKKEAELFEVVFRQKLLVVAHRDSLDSSSAR